MVFPGELSDGWEGGECGACGKRTHVPAAETCPAVGTGASEIFAVTETHVPASEAKNRIIHGAALCWAKLIFC